MLKSTILLWPLLVQIAWTMLIGVMTGRVRTASVRTREVKLGDVALGNDAWPADVKKWGNNFSNQFETPILFYTLCVVASLIGATGYSMVGPAWLYVATRVAHTLIHTGGNDIRMRFTAFLAGMAALALMLIGVVWAMV